MRLVDRSPVWLALGSAQVNWKPELCNGTGSWADIVPLVITQEACVSVYRLHLRFTAPVWEWNIRGQVMDVAISVHCRREDGQAVVEEKLHNEIPLTDWIIIASLISEHCNQMAKEILIEYSKMNDGVDLIHQLRCMHLLGVWQVYLPLWPSFAVTETLCLTLYSLDSFWSRVHRLHYIKVTWYCIGNPTHGSWFGSMGFMEWATLCRGRIRKRQSYW